MTQRWETSQAEKWHKEWEKVTFEIDVPKGCGQNIDGGCRVSPELGKDSIHSTSLTQIQTSQEAQGFRKRMKEVELGK